MGVLDVPFRAPVFPSRFLTIGESTAGETGPTFRHYRFGSKLAALIGAKEQFRAVAGSSVVTQGESEMSSTITRVLQQVVPPKVAPFGGAMIEAAILKGLLNDINKKNLDENRDVILDSLRCIFDRIQAAGLAEDGDGTFWTYAQGTGGTNWSAPSSTKRNSGGGYHSATAVGNEATLALPAEYPGDILDVWFWTQLNLGALWEYWVDEGEHHTFDTRGSGATPFFHPRRLRLEGVPDGPKSPKLHLKVKAMEGATAWLDFAQWPAAAGLRPPIFLCNMCKAPKYPTGGVTVTDAIIDEWNVLLAGLSAEYTDGTVPLVDINSALKGEARFFAADGIHPWDTGHAAITAPLYRKLTQYHFTPEQLASARHPFPDTWGQPSILTDATGVALDRALAPFTLVEGKAVVTTRAARTSVTDPIVVRSTPSGTEHGTLKATVTLNTNNTTAGQVTIESFKPGTETVAKGDTSSGYVLLIETIAQ